MGKKFCILVNALFFETFMWNTSFGVQQLKEEKEIELCLNVMTCTIGLRYKNLKQSN